MTAHFCRVANSTRSARTSGLADGDLHGAAKELDSSGTELAEANLSGALHGDSVEFTVAWPNGTQGQCSGTFDAGGHPVGSDVRACTAERARPRRPSAKQWPHTALRASSMICARVRGRAAAWSTVSCMVSSFRFGGGWDLGPAGRSHASAGPLS